MLYKLYDYAFYYIKKTQSSVLLLIIIYYLLWLAYINVQLI